MSDVFIDTNVLLRVFNEEAGFEDTIEDIAEIKSSGHDLNISRITHFELLWGYYLYAEGDDFLENDFFTKNRVKTALRARVEDTRSRIMKSTRTCEMFWKSRLLISPKEMSKLHQCTVEARIRSGIIL